MLAAALGDIARARGMGEIAKASGITREALYKALRPGSAPRFDTVSRVCAALGVRLVVQAGSSYLTNSALVRKQEAAVPKNLSMICRCDASTHASSSIW